ncbi:MAG TPA: HAMP domain-containing sensor histidine kinase [Flavobacteriales bacterium]|nr:HAMP domain-containing sensor histidine kinase [Flavobacteriales bacterium]
MKLLHRTSIYQLALVVPLVVVGTALTYVLVRAVVREEMDEQLQHQADLVLADVRNGQRTFSPTAPDVYIALVAGAPAKPFFQDTVMFNMAENEDLPWRAGYFPVALSDGSTRTVVIARSLVETEELVMVLALSMTALLALITLGNVLLNRWLSRKLWQPFHDTLGEVQGFEADGPRIPRLPDTEVDEFTMLNRTLKAMTKKLRADFTAQKRFTEQAAHELQTPMAVMQGKLDQLIQSPNMGEQEAGVIDGLFQARERMGRTVANMLLLARIGNQQFPAEQIDWSALFAEQQQLLQDLIARRSIRYTIRQDQPCSLRLSAVLAEVLVANLLRNAVQHNIPSGTVNVVIGADGFVIANNGPDLSVPPAALFERFAKGDPSSPSTGLGLSMVKEIADQNGLQLSYGYAAGVHTLVVRGA